MRSGSPFSLFLSRLVDCFVPRKDEPRQKRVPLPSLSQQNPTNPQNYVPLENRSSMHSES